MEQQTLISFMRLTIFWFSQYIYYRLLLIMSRTGVGILLSRNLAELGGKSFYKLIIN